MKPTLLRAALPVIGGVVGLLLALLAVWLTGPMDMDPRAHVSPPELTRLDRIAREWRERRGTLEAQNAP